MPRIQLKRGAHANLPTSGMLAGEPMSTTDRGNLHVAVDATTSLPVTPPIDLLVNLGAIAVGDFLIIHDTSETTGQREKRMSFADFKTALNIPSGSTDEKAAIIAGGTAGYIWGTDGTDGLLRMNTSMTWTKDASNAFVTLAVGTVDGGTF